jgi:toxin ParE1/3/4
MTLVVLSREAHDDSDVILSSLARDAGARVAARHARRFDRLYALPADHPDGGPARPRLGAGVRIVIVQPYPVFYEHDRSAGSLTVLRILHGRRRITRPSLQTDRTGSQVDARQISS